MHNVHLSVVTPAYKCADCITELHRRLTEVISGITSDYEIIFVDDGSPDRDWEIISRLCKNHLRVRGVKLSRNYGQHVAITAGLDHARGDWIVVMDCDLQDRPEEIVQLYKKANEGYDVVFARRAVRNDSLARRLSSNLFTLAYNYLGDIEFDNSVSNFTICTKSVIQSVCSLRERNRSFPIFLHEVGFRHASVNVEHSVRFAGQSAYSFAKLLDFAVQCIVSRSNKPLRLSIQFGFTLSFLAILYGSFILVRYFTHSVKVEGWTTLAVLISFLGGLGFANLGIVGLYLGKVFDEVKNRPLYFVQTELNYSKNPAQASPSEDASTLS